MMTKIPELPLEIQNKIWSELRLKMNKDNVILNLKDFVEKQRREKYYISKRFPNNESMFIYLRFTLNTILDDEKLSWRNHKSYTWYIWNPYLDKYSNYLEPIRKPSLKLKLLNFIWDLNCYYWYFYYYLCGSIFEEPPERYGYYIDKYWN